MTNQYLLRADLAFGFLDGVPISTSLPVNLGPFQLNHSPNAAMYLADLGLIDPDQPAREQHDRFFSDTSVSSSPLGSNQFPCCTSSTGLNMTTKEIQRDMPTMLWTASSVSSACSSPARLPYGVTACGTLTRTEGKPPVGPFLPTISDRPSHRSKDFMNTASTHSMTLL